MDTQIIILILAMATLLLLAKAIINNDVRQTPDLFWELHFDHLKITAMSVNAKPNQFANGQLQPVDRHGNPAAVQPGTVMYASDNTDVCTVEADPEDETKFKLNFLTVGFANVTASADADLGEGVTTISGGLQVVVEPEQATSFGITVGDPQDNA